MSRFGRNAAAATLASCALAAVCWAQGAPRFNDPADLAALSKIEHDIQAAETADGVMVNASRHAVLADLMLPGWYASWEKIYDALEIQFAQGDTSKVPEIRDLQVATNGKIACVAMQIQLDTGPNPPGKLAFRELDVFQKRSQHWLSLSGQAYFPVDPQSGSAMASPALPLRGAMAWPTSPIPAAAVPAAQGRAELRAWLDARLSQTDADKALTFYGPTDDVLVYTPYNPSEHRGLKEVRAHLAESMRGLRTVQATVTDFLAETDGAFGTLISRQNLTLTMQDGSRKNLSLRQSNCLRRIDGKWYSMIEMTSFPADPKTGKPVTYIGMTQAQ